MDMEERLERIATGHADAAAADRSGETVSDQWAEAMGFEGDDFFFEAESAEEARARMSPEDAEADRHYCAKLEREADAEQSREEWRAVKQWRHYVVLVPGLGGFWMPDRDLGSQDRYETQEAALERAAWLYHERAVSAVQVHEKTDAIIAVWPEEEKERCSD
jgi:hypothetical protein